MSNHWMAKSSLNVLTSHRPASHLALQMQEAVISFDFDILALGRMDLISFFFHYMPVYVDYIADQFSSFYSTFSLLLCLTTVLHFLFQHGSAFPSTYYTQKRLLLFSTRLMSLRGNWCRHQQAVTVWQAVWSCLAIQPASLFQCLTNTVNTHPYFPLQSLFNSYMTLPYVKKL